MTIIKEERHPNIERAFVRNQFLGSVYWIKSAAKRMIKRPELITAQELMAAKAILEWSEYILLRWDKNYISRTFNEKEDIANEG